MCASHQVKATGIPFPGQIILSVLAGGLLYMAFPPIDMGPLAWFALMPFFVALVSARTVGRGALCGLAFGLTFLLPFMHYLTMWGHPLPWIAAVLYLSLYPAVFGIAAVLALRNPSPGWRVAGMAGAWTLLSWLRANAGALGFTFGDLAYTQHDQLPVLQVASVFGEFGLTALMVVVNAGLTQGLLGLAAERGWSPVADAKRWQRRANAAALASYALLLGVYFVGAFALKQARHQEGQTDPKDRVLKVAVVQGGVPLQTPVTDDDVQRSKDTYLRLNTVVPPDTDLTVWPESALPAYITSYPGLEDVAAEGARQTKGYLLIGTLEQLDEAYYNAARLYNADGKIVDRYHKNDLLIFGEYVPLRDKLPCLRDYPLRNTDLTPGSERKLFDIKGVRVAPLICFEATFPRQTREVCREGAEVLAFLTSDAWAQNTPEVAQHSFTASMRAVESRRWVLRAATTGRSALYTPYGEVVQEIPINGQGVLSQSVRPAGGLSIYHRLGDIPLLVLSGLLWLVAAFWRPEDA